MGGSKAAGHPIKEHEVKVKMEGLTGVSDGGVL